MKTQELNQQEQAQTTGGSLLGNGAFGNDSNTIKGISEGYGNASNTDDSGDTSSTGIDFGSGSLLQDLDM